jgi:ATPase subunit of ABC transporter with duplicated ATPase domains
MKKQGVEFQNIFFSYEAMTSPLLTALSCRFPCGWTGVVGANGVGKTTILKLATGVLEPVSGDVRLPGVAVYCEQRTDEIPALFEDLVHATDGTAQRIKESLGIQDDWVNRWITLSHGERKRAQIGAMLWHRPDVLAVDEPTNHLDMNARELLAEALRTFQGIGLLVSHDRELLDSLCSQCLFVDPPEAVVRPGGYTKGLAEVKRQEEHVRKRLADTTRERKKLEREAARRRKEASEADRRLSKSGLAKRDHDARDKIDRARVTGRDAVSGRRLRQIDGRLRHVRKRQSELSVKKTFDMGIWVQGARSKRDTLFTLDEGCVPLGEARRLALPDLVMVPDDRIALTGPNGSGKSTLVRLLLEHLNIHPARVTYIPQEIDLSSATEILEQARQLPSKQLGVMMAVVSRLGSRPQRLLESVEPSPGETRKLLLAIGIAQIPHLVIMDEPTNHMDLPSIQCLEDALEHCPCGLLLVSHDRQFLKRLARKRWDIACTVSDPNAFSLREISAGTLETSL